MYAISETHLQYPTETTRTRRTTSQPHSNKYVPVEKLWVTKMLLFASNSYLKLVKLLLTFYTFKTENHAFQIFGTHSGIRRRILAQCDCAEGEYCLLELPCQESWRQACQLPIGQYKTDVLLTLFKYIISDILGPYKRLAYFDKWSGQVHNGWPI